MNRRELLSSFLGSSTAASNAETPLPGSVDVSLEPWQPSASNPWDRDAAKHLFHRLGIPASKQWLDEALKRHPQKLIDELFDERLVDELMPEPTPYSEHWLEITPYRGLDPDKNYNQEGIYKSAMMDMRHHCTVLLAQRPSLLRERLMQFWANHFAVNQVKSHYPHPLYRLYELHRKQAWGNFKQQVKDVTINPGMLMFLDNIWNEKDRINENYAREVMELFTMGLTNTDGSPCYTNEDVRDVAYAVAGWRFRFEEPPPYVLPPYFADYYFDYETKRTPLGAPPKIYGLFASNDPRMEGDIIDVMFEMRGDAIALFMSRKLYRHFVHVDAESSTATAVIEQMAARFKQDWELKPVLEMLLRSRHFFDQFYRGAIIKSPYDFMLGIMNQLDIRLEQSCAGTLSWKGYEMGQYMFNPINVRGWLGHRTWITSGTLTKRVEFLTDLLVVGQVRPAYVDGHTGFDYEWITWDTKEVIAWARQFPSFNADLVDFTTQVCDLCFAISPQDEAITTLVALVHPFTSIDWTTLNDEDRAKLIRKLMHRLMLLPEYQLS